MFHDPSSSVSKLQFSDKDLNLIAQYVRIFLDGTLDWYHLVLSRSIKDNRWTLPISGQDEKNFYHYIRACPKDSFKYKLWVKYDNVIEKCATKIQDPIHFIYCLVCINNLPDIPSSYTCKLPNHSLWVLASLWKEGLQTLIQKMNEKLPPQPFCFPVQKTFKPTEKGPTEYFLYLKDGSPLYFEKVNKLRYLDEDEWTKLQLKFGNKLI